MAKKPIHDPATAWRIQRIQLVAETSLPASLAQAVLAGAGFSAPEIRWEDVWVGQTAGPVVAPEDIEETTEVLTGWRVFSVRDYKLRGAWSTWEGRVFHASCNCKEFEEYNKPHLAGPGTVKRESSFKLEEERREDMRRHLAAGTGTCGVYSRKHLNPFWDSDLHYREIRGGRAAEVLARCVNYGLGYEYDRGYRSEYSRIEHLWLLAKGPLGKYRDDNTLGHVVPSWSATVSPATVAQILSTTYEVPCDVMTPLEFAYKSEEGLL